MINLIKEYLLKLVDNIDAGNSNLTEDETIKLISVLKELTDRERRLSKYESCRYLNVSRATFDNYVRAGKLPRGEHIAGFKVCRGYISPSGRHLTRREVEEVSLKDLTECPIA